MRDFHISGRSSVLATNGMAATSHPIGTRVAIETLEAGGNAMDAAIAGAVVLGICEPQMTGIGGDCFALFSPAGTDQVLALNGSGRAPAELDAAKIRAEGVEVISPTSAASVTMPGAVDAFCRLSEEWGVLGLDRLLAPAIHYAEHGVPVASRVAFDWSTGASGLSGNARKFYTNSGQALLVGDIFRSPTQAEVLRRIARDGRDAFYSGEVAEDMLAALVDGPHTLDDFAAVEATKTEPISAEYHGVEVCEHPPNGQGAIALLMLKTLAKFDLVSLDPFGAERAHLEAEVTKLAYAERDRVIADASAAPDGPEIFTDQLADRLASAVEETCTAQGPNPPKEAVHKDTIYITVVDRDRMAVSLIYSIFRKFGSGLASPKFGILLHNRGSGFTLEKGHRNEAAGGKRPLHTIIPGLVRRGGRVAMPFGVMGGQYQAAGHARFITNWVDYGLDIQSAIDGPRSFAYGGELQVERGYSEAVHARLAELGHTVTIPDEPIGGAQAILIDEARGVLEGASDPRKDGCALGF